MQLHERPQDLKMMNPSGTSSSKMQGKNTTTSNAQQPPRSDPYSKHNWNTNVDDDVADEADEDDLGEDLAVGHSGSGSGQNL